MNERRKKMDPTRYEARREQMLRELASDLNDLVNSGDMTAEEANEWYSAKADQWKEAA
jgi:polyhydroxyalkanoate synthesis regulator phasin